MILIKIYNGKMGEYDLKRCDHSEQCAHCGIVLYKSDLCLTYHSGTTLWYHCLSCSEKIIDMDKIKPNKEIFDRVKKLLKGEKKSKYEFIEKG